MEEDLVFVVVKCRAGSGKRRSKQIRLPMRPRGVSKGGVKVDPAWVVVDSRREASG